MSKKLKWILWIIGGLVLGCVFLVVWVTYPQISNLKYEYETASAVYSLRKYVEAHEGEWPKSWKDLGGDYSKYTKFRFDLTSDQILQNTNLIYEVATPVTGYYRTYPHARTDLDWVLQIIKEKKGATKTSVQ